MHARSKVPVLGPTIISYHIFLTPYTSNLRHGPVSGLSCQDAYSKITLRGTGEDVLTYPGANAFSILLS